MSRQSRRLSKKPARWGWIPELSDATLREVGRILFHLHDRGISWVHRRVETVKFVDDAVVRRRLSVDFTLPKRLPTPLFAPDGRPVFFVPLTWLLREVGPMNFDVEDESGSSLPLLTEREHSRLTAAMLFVAAEKAIGSGRLDAAIEAGLVHIPYRPYDDAIPFLRALLNPSSAEWRELQASESMRNCLRRDARFVQLLSLAAGNSVAVTPLVGRAGERRVIKLAFDEDLEADPGRRPKLSRARAVGMNLGWVPSLSRLPLAAVGGSETHHVQVETPPNVEITVVGLAVDDPIDAITPKVFGAAQDPRGVQAPTGPGTLYSHVRHGFATRGHLYVSSSHKIGTGLSWVGVRAERRGFLVYAAIASAIITAILGIYWHFSDAFVGQKGAGSLLLLGPGLVTAYLVRPGEHAMARRLLRFPRAVLATTALLPFAAAASLLGFVAPVDKHCKPSGHCASAELTCVLFWLAIAAAILTGLLLLCYRYPRADAST